jgi:hypothetical protein
MLRTLVLALAVATPGAALAQDNNQRQFPDSAVGIAVLSDDGTVVGHVDRVERDRRGRITAVEIAGQEPGDAPYAPSNLVAERNDRESLFISDRRDDARRSGGERARTR